jgi:hypothetical protein
MMIMLFISRRFLWLDLLLSHARSLAFLTVVQNLLWKNDNWTAMERTMPMSIHVHHGLIDGFTPRPICGLLSRIDEPIS